VDIGVHVLLREHHISNTRFGLTMAYDSCMINQMAGVLQIGRTPPRFHGEALQGLVQRLKASVARALRGAREGRKESLRDVCRGLGARYAPLSWARSTLLQYEQRGPSTEALRLLLLVRYYRLSLASILEPDAGPFSSVDIDIGVLLHSPAFVDLCRELLGIDPPNRRDAMLAALVDFLRTLRGGAKKHTEDYPNETESGAAS
jgi:transcriptional regulator with XRE-family HTH domain